MNAHVERFVEKIVGDLKSFSADLLETGLVAPGAFGVNAPRAQGMRSELGAVHSLAAFVPTLLNELQASEAPNRMLDQEASTPLRAELSRRACDYTAFDGRILPSRWTRRVSVLEPDLPALRWLLHLCRTQGEKLETAHERVHKQVQDARLARHGTSVYAKSDELALELLLQRLDDARLVLLRAEDALRRHAGRNLQPRSSPPSPYPDAAAWRSLRRQVNYWTSPNSFLPGYVRSLLADAVAVADVPYLYQRWCGLKLIQGFAARGWQTESDVAGALFLAGRIPIARAELRLDLWVEPRLTRRRDHPSGFHCVRGTDITPDFLIVTPGPYGPDCFVLDATKTSDESVLKSKERYLGSIAASAPGFVAGIPVVRHPVRAWAAAPIHSQHCVLSRADGKCGVLPLDPLDWSPKALDAWIGDVLKYATAWARR